LRLSQARVPHPPDNALAKLMPGKFEPARKLFGEAMLIEEELKQKDESTGTSCLFIHHYSDGQVSLEELGMETQEIDLIECARSSLAHLEKMAVK
jgi:hypothetical protein